MEVPCILSEQSTMHADALPLSGWYSDDFLFLARPLLPAFSTSCQKVGFLLFSDGESALQQNCFLQMHEKHGYWCNSHFLTFVLHWGILWDQQRSCQNASHMFSIWRRSCRRIALPISHEQRFSIGLDDFSTAPWAQFSENWAFGVMVPCSSCSRSGKNCVPWWRWSR